MTGRRLLLGVCGGIAAYKAAALASRLVQRGVILDVVMTADAQRFVAPLTFAALARRHVHTSLWEHEAAIPHIALARENELIAIVPATANVIAKMANGFADDALMCIALALNPQAKILIAPAMNGKMWLHPATQANVATLKKRGAEFIGPDEGMLSCGYEGIGRLWPVEKIAQIALKH